MSIQSWLRGGAIATFCGANLLLTLTPVLAQSSEEPQPQNPYDPEVVQAFIQSCTAEALSQPAPPEIDPEVFRAFLIDMCSCMIWELQDNYTAEEALELSIGLEQEQQWAENAMNPIVDACIPSEEELEEATN
ncbi:MAG: hypothetical protein ACPGVO_21950 [Spirulinaceae cyanobacterium]